MCNILTGLRMWTIFLCYILAEVKSYPMQSWPVYPQVPRDYAEDDYYYAPKAQYYYDGAAMNPPEAYAQVPYTYYYDPYGHFSNEAPKVHEERFDALPIGQETWYESESNPRWHSNDMDDVNAAFLDNLILTQMAQDAQRRRENARAAFQNVNYETKDNEDEDVRELKALAGKPLYHVPKTVPRIEDDDDDDDYEGDDADSFINWNGNKRSLSTDAPETHSEESNKEGQIEVVLPRPSHTTHSHLSSTFGQNKRSPLYSVITRPRDSPNHGSSESRRIKKRFVSSDSDLVVELRGLKHHIAT
ncbi:unnamed protein product [Leptidea sinapis]|uniref:Uncharacterized protein n=1 Tax=Leptidea sinapis TaxID=189913 RepID=A0A5E4R5Y4_9NEOP|nr:unnamed protein product [Leptidea sinapis]